MPDIILQYKYNEKTDIGFTCYNFNNELHKKRSGFDNKELCPGNTTINFRQDDPGSALVVWQNWGGGCFAR